MNFFLLLALVGIAPFVASSAIPASGENSPLQFGATVVRMAWASWLDSIFRNTGPIEERGEFNTQNYSRDDQKSGGASLKQAADPYYVLKLENGGTYMIETGIRPQFTGPRMCIAIDQYSTADQVTVGLYSSCNAGDRSFRWTAEVVEGGYRFRNAYSGKCLAFKNSGPYSYKDQGPMIQQECGAGGPNRGNEYQAFQVLGVYSSKSLAKLNYCLQDAPYTCYYNGAVTRTAVAQSSAALIEKQFASDYSGSATDIKQQWFFNSRV